MTAVAGIDGIKCGWLVVLLRDREPELRRAAHFADALSLCQEAEVIGVDMPIGLPAAAAPGGRACDSAARQVLGPKKGSCVFSPPCRQTLSARSYAEANEVNRASSSAALGVSQQAYALFPKLREIDEALTPARQSRVREVHPEVSFAALRDTVASDEADFAPLGPKKTLKGRQQRLELLRRADLLHLDGIVAAGRELGAAPDDTLDACVAAWTARRIVGKGARRLSPCPPKSEQGLFMEIWA